MIRQTTSAAALLALAWMAGPAAAQDDVSAAAPAPTGTAPADSTPTEAKGRELPTVIVTAQKVAQTLEQVPAAVTTLDGEFIENSGITRFIDLQNYTANVNLAIGTSSAQIGVRGFTTPNTNPAFDPSVGSVVDGIYYGRNSFLTAFLNDLDRVEILKGPQGTLFGKNSTAGVLNVATRNPQKNFEAGATVIYSDDRDGSVRPMVNIGLTDKLLLRVSGNYSKNEGLLYNTFLKRREANAKVYTTRAKLRYLLDDDWTLDFQAFTSKQDLNFNIYTVSRVGNAMRDLATSFDPNFTPDVNSRKVSANVPTNETGVIRGAAFTADHDFGKVLGLSNFHFITITSYAEQLVTARDLDGDFTAIPFVRDTLIQESPFRQISEEFRFTGGADDLFGFGKGINFIAGFFFYQATYNTSDLFQVEDLGNAARYFLAVQQDSGTLPPGTSVVVGPLGPVISVLGQQVLGDQNATVVLDQISRTYAFFSQVDYAFDENWGLIGGFRIGLETKNGHAMSRANGILVPAIADQEDHDTTVSREEVDVSPKLGLTWGTDDKLLNTYATWTRGFKSGGFNGLPLTARSLEYGPERAESYEIGAKARTLNGSLFLGAAVFNTTFSDLQLSSYRNNSFVVLNAGQARSRGVDFDLRWLPPIEGTQIFAALGYADARYVEYKDAPATADSGASTQDLSGARLPFASDITASVVPSYTLYFDWLGGFTATTAFDFIYKSEAFLDVDNDSRKVQPDTYLYNARMTFAAGDKTWSATFGINNITNVLIVDQVIGQPLAPGNFVSARSDRGRYLTANLAYYF